MAACENQGKQHELSDHWKSIKTFLKKKKKKKKKMGWWKKTKRLTGIQILAKDFTSYKIRYKSLRKIK